MAKDDGSFEVKTILTAPPLPYPERRHHFFQNYALSFQIIEN
jgi:hypothetical protein